MNYMTFVIDGLESLVNLDEYCIFQKSYDCTKKPTIIFHAQHNKDFMLSFETEAEREYVFDEIKRLYETYQLTSFAKSMEWLI